MFRLQGTPFLPGHARGRLQRGPGDAAASIVTLRQQDLPYAGPAPLGVIVVDGAPLSHPLLRLRALGVPMVLVDAAAAARLPYGEIIALDGEAGTISTDPSAPVEAEPAAPPRGQPLLTRNGTAIELCASISHAADARAAVARGAAAIGLLRSEYVFHASGVRPDTAFLQAALGAVCEAARPLGVTIRLIDIAADKRPPWLKAMPGLAGVLGLQGARLYELEPVRSVLHAELAAVDTLAERFELQLLIPYLTQLEELERTRAAISARLGRPLPVGAMLETPAAALAAGSWMEAADFVALGCNDLMQALFAADRDQPALHRLLDAYSPVLYRFLRGVAVEAGERVREILVCGLLAQLPRVLPLLLGLGYRRFSVDPALIPWLARTVQATSLDEAGAQAASACAARHSAELRSLLGLASG
jgi:phosphoenolpyruvate-protein kinase (PTS system EI component)